ncbi:hypothetical protein [Paludisphaera mucosa]|uniref:Uncharacterized protein n=1 Tax=Paludisphaera mucosa TaxID=3030827 RepID=A0ABT6FE58_9BACT|nr:hypothetical protein [Paludisphaera mucosa]MDG3005862.1 hypothetical protein [Paludisphaera mucosa]
MDLIDRMMAGLSALGLNLPLVDERRTDHRFVSSARVMLVWADHRGSHEVAASVANISRGGAALRAVGVAPLLLASVLVVLGDGHGRREVAAEIRGIHACADGTSLIRLAFHTRCPTSTVESIAGVKLGRPSRRSRPDMLESLEGRQLLSAGAVLPQAPILVAAPPTGPMPPSLYSLADDSLLSSILYSTPGRMASDIAESGAIGVNAAWEAGGSNSWFIEQQRYGADFVQAGLVRGDAALVARGWKILDWGFARQAVDGSFVGTGDAFHSTSMFVEAAARALLLTAQSHASDAPTVLARYLPKLDAAARWLATPGVAAKGDFNDAPYTHRRWLLAAALGETAAAMQSPADPTIAAHYRADAEALSRAASDYAARGHALQAADGVNPEKGGSDTSYQAYGILMAERFLTTCRSPELRGQVEAMIVRGLGWLSARVGADGQVASSDDSRTGTEASRSGTVKSIDYKTMIQAFSFATTTTTDVVYRNVARRLAVGRGWLK